MEQRIYQSSFKPIQLATQIAKTIQSITPTAMTFQLIFENGEISYNSKFQSKWLHIAFTCRYAECWPRHLCRPPPMNICENYFLKFKDLKFNPNTYPSLNKMKLYLKF